MERMRAAQVIVMPFCALQCFLRVINFRESSGILFFCAGIFFAGNFCAGIFFAGNFWCRKFGAHRKSLILYLQERKSHRRKIKKGRYMEEKRIAVLGIIIEDVRQAEQVNALLHQFGTYIIGRMGIPYKEKQLNIISIVVDAPADVISALSGKLGRLPGVSSKALYSKTGSGQGSGRKEETRRAEERKSPGSGKAQEMK